ncbi:TonB-dependent receptor plug domain protein [Leptospira broomii serovar Hurstbridge str. 5399]|uniref:TonB-dependent receptor plug domain protein n=1 Tax=Leptospira broomii serovar Hurstbridge str. 5399 TaxID=1049789 RepID=T0F6Z5_9LEPT|nr:TonB-dependent receptor plug domain-containing protein [Leptospira broomii]EQA46910.1 TonB-dependent receptor plug domain protein [Leptospira broomii serovar Hurstbridge str. 5399]
MIVSLSSELNAKDNKREESTSNQEKRKYSIGDAIEIRDKKDERSVSEGRISGAALRRRPMQSTGEIAEAIPGVLVTQHSGGGKANQYYLRGFDLDHGTDMAASIDGVPINMPTHAHGQGYIDLNFIIPELIHDVHYKKGVYYAEEGDFSSAGAMNISYSKSLQKNLYSVEVGSLGYKRIFIAESKKIGKGNILFGAEYSTYNGAWTIPDRYKKLNSVLSYSLGDEELGMSITAMGYKGAWHATNQIPQRAIQKGRSLLYPYDDGLNLYDPVDRTDGGSTHRTCVTFEGHKKNAYSEAKIVLYGVYYDLGLYSDYTFYMVDPDRGDQAEQVDQRTISGMKNHYKIKSNLFSFKMENTFGFQLRRDSIHNSLYHTESRSRLDTESNKRIVETSLSPTYENRIHWVSKIVSIIGIRSDAYYLTVNDNVSYLSTQKTSNIVSPKASWIFGPWGNIEFFLNYGCGFHSNDAKGILNRISPVTPLVRTKGGEVGMRAAPVKQIVFNVAYWFLGVNSELVFNGDSGNTDPSGRSIRKGIELSLSYKLNSWLNFDEDISYSNARYTNGGFFGKDGDYVPQAIHSAFSSGLSVTDLDGFFGALRVRYFGPRPLVQNNSVRSTPSTFWNIRIGKKISENISLSFDIFNIFNSHAPQVQYYYATRLKNEGPGPVDGGYNDTLTHPTAPRNFRVSISGTF